MALRMEDDGSRHPQDAVDFGDRLLRRTGPRQTEVTPPRGLAVGRLVRGGKIGVKDEKGAADATNQRKRRLAAGLRLGEAEALAFGIEFDLPVFRQRQPVFRPGGEIVDEIVDENVMVAWTPAARLGEWSGASPAPVASITRC